MAELLPRLLQTMRQMETEARGDVAALQALEAHYEGLAALLEGSSPFLVQRNRFRLRHAAVMSLRRPKVLFGRLPVRTANFQLTPLLRTADVVCLSLHGGTGEIDVLDASPLDPLPSALKRLPEGFWPDYYFDYQVETANIVPRGVESVPFPTVASLCHHFEASKIELIGRLYDFVIPLSHRFEALLAPVLGPEKLISLPFGLSWGSFDTDIDVPPATERDIDVLLSFGATGGAIYGTYREELVRLFRQSRERLGRRFNFVEVKNVDRQTYLGLLARSKIVLNTVGVHGPYNYRTCEAMNAGAVLMERRTAWITGPQCMERYFKPGLEFASCGAEDFEKILLTLLVDPALRHRIAEAGQARLKRDYAHESLHRRLQAHLAGLDLPAMSARRPDAAAAALARVRMHLRDPPRSERAFAAADLGSASGFDDQAALRLMLALGPACFTASKAFDATLVCDQLMSSLEAPSVTDRWNHMITTAEAGLVDRQAARALLIELADPDLDWTDDQAFNLKDWPQVSGAPEGFAEALACRIRNIGVLVAAGDAGGRRRAVLDFMRAWIHGLLAMTGSATDLDHCRAIIDAYDIQLPSDETLASVA